MVLNEDTFQFQLNRMLRWAIRNKEETKFLKDKRYWEGYTDALSDALKFVMKLDE